MVAYTAMRITLWKTVEVWRVCAQSEKHGANWDSHEDCHCKAFMHAEGDVLNKLKVLV